MIDSPFSPIMRGRFETYVKLFHGPVGKMFVLTFVFQLYSEGSSSVYLSCQTLNKIAVDMYKSPKLLRALSGVLRSRATFRHIVLSLPIVKVEPPFLSDHKCRYTDMIYCRPLNSFRPKFIDALGAWSQITFGSIYPFIHFLILPLILDG